MAEFLVELYVSQAEAAVAVERDEQARASAEELAAEGLPIAYVRSIFVPEDETCLLLYEAASGEAVREAMTRAGLPFERIAEVVSSALGDERSTSNGAAARRRTPHRRSP